jgi:hypothetical protein
MRLTACLLCSAVFGCLLASPRFAPAQAPKAPAFAVSYHDSGLVKIDVESKFNGVRLRYLWHLNRSDSPVAASLGGLDAYDRFEIEVWLSKAELDEFRAWARRHKVFDFKASYPSASKGRDKAAVYQTTLSVSLGDRKSTIAWVGDSKTPEGLGEAVRALLKVADKVKKSRLK